MPHEAMDKILALQERDMLRARLAKEIEDLPRMRRDVEARLKTHQVTALGLKEEVKKTQVAIKDTEMAADAARQKIQKFREQQLQIKSNLEYRALENEIAGQQEQVRGIEDKELALMEQAEALRGQLAAADAELKADEQFVRNDLRELDQRAAALAEEARQLDAERAERAAQIPNDALRRYERIFQHVHGAAVVGIDNASCGGCHMKLPPQIVHDAQRGSALVQCSFCGRLLHS